MEEELAEGILVIPGWTTQAWFPQVMRMLVANPRLLTKREGVVFLPSNPEKKTSTTGENEPDGLPFIRKSFQNQGISKRSSDILISAWRDGTQKQNKVYLKQWRNFCSKWKIDPFTPPLGKALDFLTELFDEGKQYSAINSKVSSINDY